jgi:recombination protein RecA
LKPGTAFSQESCLIDLGVEHNILEKSGTWYSYNDVRLGQGKENVREFLVNNPEMANEIEARIRELLSPKPAPEPESEPEKQSGDGQKKEKVI